MFVEENKREKNGKIALKLCKKIINPTEEEKQSIIDEKDKAKRI